MIVNKKYMKKDPVDVFTTVAAVFAISVIALWAVANVFRFVAWLFRKIIIKAYEKSYVLYSSMPANFSIVSNVW